MIHGNIDSRAVHVKVISINGQLHFVSVMPPQEATSDDMVWRFPRPNTLAFYSFQLEQGTTGLWDDNACRAYA